MKKLFGPREKIIDRGPESLKDEELIAVIIGNGGKRKDVFSLSKQINELIIKGNVTIEQLQKIPYIGKAKSAQILALLEFCKRKQSERNLKINSAKDVYLLVQDFSSRKKEYFILITLDGANKIIEKRVVFVGTLNYSVVHPREIFALALEDRSASIIVVHNHPSGELSPSEEDIKITYRLKDAGKLMGIPLLDHIIISLKGYYSFKEGNLL